VGKQGTEVTLQTSAHKWSNSAEPTVAISAMECCYIEKDSIRIQETQKRNARTSPSLS